MKENNKTIETYSKQEHIKDRIVVISVGILVLSLSILAWIIPGKAYSDTERRYLDQMPAFDAGTVLSGSFMKEFEGYTVDQFPARDAWRGLKSKVEMHGFMQKDVHDIYTYDGYLSKMEYPMDVKSLDRAAFVFQTIYEKYLAGTDSKVYFSIIPDKNCFMAKESGHLSMDYDAFYEYMQSRTDFMEYIEIASLLELSDYYKTDTHWRQEQIADVAKELLAGMGTLEDTHSTALETYGSDYVRKCIDEKFYGVYVGQSGLLVSGEELYYLDHERFKSCKVYDHEHGKEIAIYDMEKAHGKDPYELFLSGPLSLVTIENPNAKTDKELILFRDSFGSAAAPLLTDAYAKITLVDIRYLSSSLLHNWITFEDQDVLFLYSTQVLNNSETMK